MKVVLLAAGLGTRMGHYASVINKVLLPYDKKAIISHIIDQFPPVTEFIVPVGYKADMVIDYLTIAHSDRRFTFVHVDNFDEPGSGPAYSVRCCEEYLKLEPFYIIACDGIYGNIESLFSSGYNAVAVAHVTEDESISYCNVQVDDGRVITRVEDKQRSKFGYAVSGAFYIGDIDYFWYNLKGSELSSGWDNGESLAVTLDWLDLGTIERYTTAHPNGEFDFSKTDEFFWDVNGKIIKWFSDPRFATDRYDRAKLKPDVFPHVFPIAGWLAYDKVEGLTLYEHCTPEIFDELIKWLSFNLWKPPKETTHNLRPCDLENFYFHKTMDRLKKFREKYPTFNPVSVNGKKIEHDIDTCLNNLNWRILFNDDLGQRSVFFHGDLQFDNILFTPDGFKLIDWRQDFAGRLAVGDLYYDVAKLCGGLIINYKDVKEGHFFYKETENGDHRFCLRQYPVHLEMLAKLKHMLPFPVIDDIISLIFLNMAPLHSEPFDKLLFCLALERLNDFGRSN